MDISFIDRVKVLRWAWKTHLRHGDTRGKISNLIKPIDFIRYHEFSYIFKIIENMGMDLKGRHILDISSPYLISHYFHSKDAMVVRTDINYNENINSIPGPNCNFVNLNAINLPFQSRSFDFVYSISAVEHIYQGYLQAIREMLRVTRPKGFIYITFHTAREHTEEWIDDDPYGSQYSLPKKGVFFQYRFGAKEIANIIDLVNGIASFRHFDIYWENIDGTYDLAVNLLKKKYSNQVIEILKNSFINYFCGFACLADRSGGFDSAQSLGNAHLLLEKN